MILALTNAYSRKLFTDFADLFRKQMEDDL